MKRLFVVAFMHLVLSACAGGQVSPDDPACQPPPPPARLASHVTIAPTNEPGTPLRLQLQFTSLAGRPHEGLLVYAYHTNAQGVYAKRGNESGCFRFHGYLHGWGVTDSNGRVEFRTIRPAPYPNDVLPAHVHVVVRFAGQRGFYLNDITFADDTLVTERYRSTEQLPGGSGVVRPVRSDSGWVAARVVQLAAPSAR